MKGYDEYVSFFKDCAENTEVQQAYLELLREIKDYCASKETELIFLIIPNAMHPELSKDPDSQVEEMLKTLNIRVVNATDELLEIPLQDRIISRQDMHLSKTSNEVVAGMVYLAIQGE